MCAVHDHQKEEGKMETRTDKRGFSFSGDNETMKTASDSSKDSSISSADQDHHHKHFSWRNHLAVTRARAEAPPSRSYSSAVTHARTTLPKPPLPIKAVRAMNCASLHSKTLQQQQVLAEQCDLPERKSSLKSANIISSNEMKKVRFGDLEMRNYEVVLGDHPDCSSGPPVSIGWEYAPVESISVDKYESLKPSRSRKSIDQLELNYFVRKRMLRRNSLVSDEEMRKRIDEVHRIQKQRMRTKRMQPIYKVREAFMGVGERMTSPFRS